VKNLKISFLLALAIGSVSIFSCSKSNNSSSGSGVSADSVLYSPWISIAMTPTDNGDTIFTQSIPAASITSAVLNKGTVLGYLLEGDPLTGDSSIVDAVTDLSLVQYFAVGSVDLVDFGEDLSGASYRYVIIPGRVAVTDASGKTQYYTADQLKKLNYASLSKLLRIPAKGGSSLLRPAN
jgi:hypothetical protein